MSKKIFAVLILFSANFALVFSVFAQSAQKTQSAQENPQINYAEPSLREEDKVEFSEVWAWVITGGERDFTSNKNVSDLCYFSADINSYGEITNFPDPTIFKNYKGRKHLVVTCSGYALTHTVLNPKYDERNKIISSIVKNSKTYDGVQIDFETILSKDDKYFLSFIKTLRKKLPKDKMFTICVPARNKSIQNDIFDYALIEPFVDRIIIMAYDQHWSTSEPGPVAGKSWCQGIINYAQTVIPQEKLVMGLPFYGRSWQDTSFNKAWLNSGVNRIIGENQITEIKRYEDIPHTEFETTIKVNLWWDDTFSLVKRLQMYQENSVDKVAFWRIGQEENSFWNWISLNEDFFNSNLEQVR